MDFEYSDRTKALIEKLNKYMDEVVYPAESVYDAELETHGRWKQPPVMEELKRKSRAAGLWNLFLPESERGAEVPRGDEVGDRCGGRRVEEGGEDREERGAHERDRERRGIARDEAVRRLRGG